MMLSHARPYREFPHKWVEAALARKGLEVFPTEVFTMKLGPTCVGYNRGAFPPSFHDYVSTVSATHSRRHTSQLVPCAFVRQHLSRIIAQNPLSTQSVDRV